MFSLGWIKRPMSQNNSHQGKSTDLFQFRQFWALLLSFQDIRFFVIDKPEARDTSHFQIFEETDG